ncbi:hypothetical protein NV226_01675 [Mycoplasma iguanae]|uniref:NfeD-like C-terminal domain-containing protein n=1 Tax=Mycoplasma iguanae TaxID=292461 RepID=A0ABY5R7D4_9MOLU|nr:NfeD family protein [Mycoplasma iguanae]UVD81426.1 hypothetical protein NV226_01675 [Mycoplasma iguanae]
MKMTGPEIVKWIFVTIWSFIFLCLILTEIFTTGIFSGIGAVAIIPTIIIALVWGEKNWTIAIQFLVVLIFWTAGYFIFYKILKKIINSKSSKFIGSIEDYIGQEFQLIETSTEIHAPDLKYGKLKIQDKVFRVLSDKKEGIIEKGSLVIITKIEGNTFFVKKAQK